MPSNITPMRTDKKNDWTSKDGLRDLISCTNLHNFHMAELGSYAGESSEVFLEFSVQKLYAIDTWAPFKSNTPYNPDVAEKAFDKKISQWISDGHNVHKMKMDTLIASQHIGDKTLDIVYVDTEHTYDGIIKNAKVWIPKLKTGGFFTGHDYSEAWPGVIRAVDELVLQYEPQGFEAFRVFQDTSWALKFREI